MGRPRLIGLGDSSHSELIAKPHNAGHHNMARAQVKLPSRIVLYRFLRVKVKTKADLAYIPDFRPCMISKIL